MIRKAYLWGRGGNMTIRVVYHANTCDTIPFFVLQLGIDCKKIKMFYRNTERRWVTVGAEPIRMGAQYINTQWL